MFSATSWACREAMPAIFASAVETSPIASTLAGGSEVREWLAGPLRGDLAGELAPAGPRPDEEDALGVPQLAVGGSIVVDGVVGIVSTALGRERVGRSGCEDDVVRGDFLPRCQHHPMSGDLHGTVANHTAMGQEAVVGQEDLGEG